MGEPAQPLGLDDAREGLEHLWNLRPDPITDMSVRRFTRDVVAISKSKGIQQKAKQRAQEVLEYVEELILPVVRVESVEFISERAYAA